MEDKYFMIDPLISNKMQKYQNSDEKEDNLNFVLNNKES